MVGVEICRFLYNAVISELMLLHGRNRRLEKVIRVSIEMNEKCIVFFEPHFLGYNKYTINIISSFLE
jgi:hypothetical protein